MVQKRVNRVYDSIELEEDLTFQRRQWKIQRAGWILMLRIVLAALAGLLGHGPLSQTTRTDPSGALSVKYYRFEHASALTELQVHVGPEKAKDGKVRLSIDAAYLGRIRMMALSPLPLQVEQRDGRHVYVFACDEHGPLDLTIHYEHEDWGKVEGKIGLADGPEALAISQIVYP